jgi:hypothetical protein
MTSSTPAKKRLTFSVEESLHSRLKAEAAAQGVPLGTYCSAILEGGAKASSTIEELDPATLAAMPLGVLREMCAELGERKPMNWQRSITRVNAEIRRRYRTSGGR